VLATEGLTTSMAEQMLGLPLRGWHIHGSVSEGVVETVIPARRRKAPDRPWPTSMAPPCGGLL